MYFLVFVVAGIALTVILKCVCMCTCKHCDLAHCCNEVCVQLHKITFLFYFVFQDPF
jgi:hypothetical protein